MSIFTSPLEVRIAAWVVIIIAIIGLIFLIKNIITDFYTKKHIIAKAKDCITYDFNVTTPEDELIDLDKKR